MFVDIFRDFNTQSSVRTFYFCLATNHPACSITIHDFSFSWTNRKRTLNYTTKKKLAKSGLSKKKHKYNYCFLEFFSSLSYNYWFYILALLTFFKRSEGASLFICGSIQTNTFQSPLWSSYFLAVKFMLFFMLHCIL